MKTFEIVTDDPYWDRFNDMEDEDYNIKSISRVDTTFPCVDSRSGEVVDTETIYTWTITLEEPAEGSEQIQEIVDILKCQLKVTEES
jgi:uncharacterized protein (DUF2344 family)